MPTSTPSLILYTLMCDTSVNGYQALWLFKFKVVWSSRLFLWAQIGAVSTPGPYLWAWGWFKWIKTREPFWKYCRRQFVGLPTLNMITYLPNHQLYECTELGWKMEEGVLSPQWMTIPEASKSCQELIKCSCKTKCSGRCKCRKAGLSCTELCICTVGCV